MFETTPPQPLSDHCTLDELLDPVGSVVAVGVSRRFVRLCMSWAEPMIADLAGQETLLRQPGGIDLTKRLVAQRMYRRVDAEIFEMLRRSVPLTHAECVLSRVEELLRRHFAEVVETAASHLLSDDRDVAIQLLAVATTMAGREVRTEVAEIIAQTRPTEVAEDAA